MVSALSAGIHTCAPLDDTSPVEPAANVADDLSHLLGEEGLGLVELKVTVALCCYHGAILSWLPLILCVFRNNVTCWLSVTQGCFEISV